MQEGGEFLSDDIRRKRQTLAKSGRCYRPIWNKRFKGNCEAKMREKMRGGDDKMKKNEDF